MFRKNGYTVTYQMRKQQRQYRKRIINVVLLLFGAILLGFLVIQMVAFSLTIHGDSMAPTYENGEKHLVNRWIYRVKKPARYDIIVFALDDDTSKQFFVKRVVGLPGETIQIKDGDVYVDDKKTESFSSDKILSAGLAGDKLVLGEDEYFVLGDNYNNSDDSRSDSIGNVKKENIIGKVGIKYWPFG